MKPILRIITIACIAASSMVAAAGQLLEETECVTEQIVPFGLRPLQGTWKGVDVNDPSLQQVTIKITGDSLHFHRDDDFWFKTTIALPAGRFPKQLHATIKECPPGQASSVGEVVMAIYKIEDGKLTLVTIGEDTEEAKHTFDGPGSRYELRKIPHPTPPE